MGRLMSLSNCFHNILLKTIFIGVNHFLRLENKLLLTKGAKHIWFLICCSTGMSKFSEFNHILDIGLTIYFRIYIYRDFVYFMLNYHFFCSATNFSKSVLQ